MTTNQKLRYLAAATAWFTAIFPLRTAGWLLTLYATHGGGIATGLRLATPALLWTLAYVVAGILYLLIATTRLPLLLAAALLTVTGAIRIPGYLHPLSTLDPWHNVLATGFWETLGCAAFTLTALLERLTAAALRIAPPDTPKRPSVR